MFSSAIIRNIQDIEGHEYPIKKIGDRLWLSSNLQTAKFQNGDPINIIQSDEEWEQAGEAGKPACCWYDMNEFGLNKHGMLYNWFAVTDGRGLAPSGWRIPTRADWMNLVESQGGWSIAGRKLKAKSGWNYFGSGNNLSGFTALPGGGRGALGSRLDLGDYGNWWCQEACSEREAHFFYLTFVDSEAKIEKKGFKASGLSVRCVKSLI